MDLQDRVDIGMDSSRGGPLTTFIMMLPLIVVPAIAMLRPANQNGGLISEWLSAATGGGDADNAPSDATEDPDIDPFEQLFADSASPGGGKPNADSEIAAGGHEIDAALFAEVTGESLAGQMERQPMSPATGGPSDDPEPGLNSQVDSRTSALLAQLKQLGMIRTLWFSPGDGQIGFVAFFLPGEGIVSYRFDAVAATHEAAVRAVMQQVQDWRRNRGQ